MLDKLQIKPNRWSCSVTAFAMAMQMPVRELIEVIGHDGSEIIFPDLPEPMCRRGFHSQEFIEAGWKLGFACTPVELFPRIQAAGASLEPFPVWFGTTSQAHCERFDNHIKNSTGVLEGRTRRCNHAMCNRYGTLLDPDGHTYEYSLAACGSHGFCPFRFWIVSRI